MAKCANILGNYHVKQITEAFQFIHQYVFNETNGNALMILERRIREQFSECLTEEIPESWFYWPLTRGGLGLKNVYLDLYSLKNQLSNDMSSPFTTLLNKDSQVYDEVLKEYEQSKRNYSRFQPRNEFDFMRMYLEINHTFMPLEEFIARRQSHLSHWRNVYETMLKVNRPSLPVEPSSTRADLKILENSEGRTVPIGRRSAPLAQSVDTYMQWLFCYYGEQIESVFQQLDFVDSESLPIGLITMMEQEDIDWDKRTKIKHLKT